MLIGTVTSYAIMLTIRSFCKVQLHLPSFYYKVPATNDSIETSLVIYSVFNSIVAPLFVSIVYLVLVSSSSSSSII